MRLEQHQSKNIFCFQQSFFTLLLCLCAFQVCFERTCSLDSKTIASTDIDELRLQKQEVKSQLCPEIDKARKLEAEIELIEACKKEKTWQILQEVDRKERIINAATS